MLQDKAGSARTSTCRGALAACLCVLVASVATAQRPNRLRTLRLGGVERSYLLHVPARTRQGVRLPLVLVFHGGGGSGRRMAEHTGFHRLGESQGFVVVYPNALSGRWNDGRVLSGAPHDDVAFVRALLDTLRRELPIDPARIYATGISNGAMFSHRLACDMSGVFAAIGAVAGALPAALAPGCTNAAPLSLIALQGTDDGLIPFDGGGSGAARGAVLSARETAAHWALRAGCDNAPAAPRRIDRVRDGTAVSVSVFQSCGRHAVELLAIIGGGHTWPGGPRVTAPRLGRTTRELDATRTLWEFFARHPN